MRDQGILNTFTDVMIVNNNKTTLEYFTNIKFSLRPPSGTKLNDFDFDLFLTKDYYGFESSKVEVKGVATLKDGTLVPFSAPVALIKIQYVLSSKYNKLYKFNALKFIQKEWKF